jgi:hypothetical protein
MFLPVVLCLNTILNSSFGSMHCGSNKIEFTPYSDVYFYLILFFSVLPEV